MTPRPFEFEEDVANDEAARPFLCQHNGCNARLEGEEIRIGICSACQREGELGE